MRKIAVMLAVLLLSVGSARADFWGGFAGGAAGAVVGGFIQNQFNRPQPQPYYYPQPMPAPAPAAPAYVPEQRALSPEQIAYCARRFKSWNIRTGLYRGYDGNFYRCP